MAPGFVLVRRMSKQQPPIVWQGASWRVRAGQVRLPDGRRVEHASIDHPGAVVLVPLRHGPEGVEVLMLEQYRPALQQVILELPAGTRGADEDWAACARRELREETGQRAETLFPLGELWPAPGYTNEIVGVYLATGLSPDPLPADEDEAIEVRLWPLTEIVDMAHKGALQDAKSVVAIVRAARFLADNPDVIRV